MLNNTELQKLRKSPPSQTKKFSDGCRDGFFVQVTPAGTCTFLFGYTFSHKQRFIKIGRYPDVSLKEAREKAKEKRALVAEGIDPREHQESLRLEKQKEKEDYVRQPTVAYAAGEYLRLHVSGLKSKRAVTGYFDNHILPEFGDRRLVDCRLIEFLEFVERKAISFPNLALKLLNYLKHFFEWCVKRQYIEHNLLGGLKPKDIKVPGVKDALKPVACERTLSEQEISVFWKNIGRGHTSLPVELVLKMILVTGARPGEVAGMRYSEIEGRWWTIPAARREKTNTSYSIYLSNLACEILEEAKSSNTLFSSPDSDFVFSYTKGHSVRVDSLSQAVRRMYEWARRKENASFLDHSFVIPDLPDWTPHDLRRTFRTGLSELGISSEIAEVAIGHEMRGIIKVYNKYDYKKEVEEAMTSWSDRLHKLIG